MKIVFIILLSLMFCSAKAQFPGTDSLRNYNNKYITNNPATAFTNLRLNTLLRGIIDWVDTARAGTGGGGALGIDTMWALNDSTVRYRKNGVFRNMVLKGVYDTRRKVDSMYKVNDTTIGFKINGTARTIIIPGRTGMNLANSALTADNDYTHNWAQHYLKFDSTDYTEFNSYRPDPYLFSGNIFTSKFYLDSTSQGRPFSLSWSLRNGANDGDSIRGVLETNESTTSILNSGDNNNQFGNWQFIGNSNNPRLTGTLFGDLKSSSYSFGHVATINPVDSTRLKAVAAATAPKMAGLRAVSSDVYTVVAIDLPAGGSATLSNVGSGYRLVKTADGQIKTIFVGYGLDADSTTNTNGITIKADTSELVTPSDLTDAVALPVNRVAYGNGTITSEAAFTYNSTTNKLSVDSLLIKKGFADSLMMGAYESDVTDSSTFFGTSITAGTDANPLLSNRYSALVAAGLRTIEINKGQGGFLLQHSPSWPLDNTFKDHYTTLIQPKTASSRYMFFAWGENDATNEQMYGGLFGVDTSFFKRDYGIVVNYAVSLGWSLSDIIIISPFYQLTATCPLAMQQKYVDASHHFADSMGLKWIDVFTQGKNYNSLILTDYIHPSNYGHSFYAYTILKGMNQALQAKSGENLINPYTTLLNEVKFFGKDTANAGYALAAINPNGSLTKVPSERYLLMDNTNVPSQSGNASVLNNINAGKIVRAMGQNSISTGAGFEMSYDGAHGIFLPVNWSGPSFGNIVMPFSKLTIGNSFTSPWSRLYVDGSVLGKGVFVSDNPNETYNTITNTQTLNLLVTTDSIGGILTKGVSGYRPLSLNGSNSQPVFINTYTDNGSGARLQVNGDATVTDEAYDATAWNGSLEVPTKNAIRDKIQSMSGGIASINSQTGSSQTISGGAGINVGSSSDVHTVSLNTTLDVQVSDANNTGTSATDLYSKTIAANQLTLNGQSIHFEAAGVNNDATATVNLEALFAGNGIAGTGAVAISGTGAWTIRGTIIRATSTTARVYTTVSIDNTTQKIFSTTGNLTGLDWTTTNILKIQATAGGAGGGSNDITAQMWKVIFQP